MKKIPKEKLKDSCFVREWDEELGDYGERVFVWDVFIEVSSRYEVSAMVEKKVSSGLMVMCGKSSFPRGIILGMKDLLEVDGDEYIVSEVKEYFCRDGSLHHVEVKFR